MLIDDLLNNQSWKKAGVIESLRTRLTKAPKFILRIDFAMAVDELTHSNWSRDCDKIVPLCRLPYRECWIEVLAADRLAHRAGTRIREYELKVKRVGWLLTQVNPSGAWKAEMFWSVDTNDPTYQEVLALSDPEFWSNAPISGAIAAVHFDPQAATAEEAIRSHSFSEFGITTMKLSKKYLGHYDYNFKGILTDWEGEGSFLMATLALLNSKNVVDRTPVTFKRKNKGAKKLLHDHEVISITRRYTNRNMDPAATSSGRKFRAHWCRGHFKVRKTGIFFWTPHRRGDLTLGPIRPKNYEVTR